MSATGSPAAGTRLVAAVVLSACVGLVGGGLGAWGVYTHFGPAQRVVTETRNGGGAVSVGDIASSVQASLVTVSTRAVTSSALLAGGAGLVEGFVVSADGLIVTSAHAVRGATRLRVAAADGRAYDATVAATDLPDGIAVLRAAGASGMTPLRVATADPHIGDLAVAVFRPPLGTLTTRSGVVASVGMNANDGTSDLTELVSVDATPAPAADGAPLVDGTGSVIGVVTLAPSLPGVLAASGAAAAALVSGVQRGGAAPAATFGFSGVLIGAAAAAATGLPQGLLVQATVAGGPAAGLVQPGDVVTSVNGSPVVSARGVTPADFSLASGDRATLQVRDSDGASRTVDLVVDGG